jgi:hypothetical protein
MSLTAATAKPVFGSPESPEGTVLPWPKVHRRLPSLSRRTVLHEGNRTNLTHRPHRHSGGTAERGNLNVELVDEKSWTPTRVHPACYGGLRPNPGNVQQKSPDSLLP